MGRAQDIERMHWLSLLVQLVERCFFENSSCAGIPYLLKLEDRGNNQVSLHIVSSRR